MSRRDRTTTAESSTTGLEPRLDLPGPPLPATLAVGVATLLSAIAFVVSAFVSVTGDSQALPSGVHGAPATAEAAARPGAHSGTGLDLQPTWGACSEADPLSGPMAGPLAESEARPATLFRALSDLGELLLETRSGAAPTSTGACPLAPSDLAPGVLAPGDVAPAVDRVRQLRVYVVESTTAPA